MEGEEHMTDEYTYKPYGMTLFRMNEEDIEKAWKLMSTHNSELLLENERLRKQLEANYLRRSLWYRIKRAVDMLRGKSKYD
jgi:regulator of replication initiation timing